MEQLARKTEEIAPIFGLRYLEEEDAEINGIAGCMAPIDNGDPGETGTWYTTACDYQDGD
jgi:hypothetical protein